MRVDPKQLYWGDNGICLCGEHLDTNTQTTGNDRHGFPIRKVTTLDIIDFRNDGLAAPACESSRHCPR